MKLWGGRFAKGTAKVVEDFHSSISFDKRLYREDIDGSLAHAEMLAACGIISADEGRLLQEGLLDVLSDIEAGRADFSVEAEDIHMNIEKLLTAKIGDAGKKLHTARSRNDQVALDTRLWLKKAIKDTLALLLQLQEQLLAQAKQHTQTVMPGYTHLQRAQPISFAHHLLAYFQMFTRDYDRFCDCEKRLDYSPLGSCALAGTPLSIDRQQTAALLGFKSPTANSLDGVSDRDFAIEYCAAASLLMMHLSRFCEEIILWSSSEFGFISLDDAYSTGSSIMPQKKNPDVAELVRGKTGRVYGDLVTLLTVMKSLPLAYNKDMQEDKEALFDAADTVKGCLTVFTPMLATVTVNADRMREAASGSFLNATDLADYLASRGLPFREAHAVSGRLVLYCEKQGKSLNDLTMAEFKAESPLFDEDIYDAIALQNSLAGRTSLGGPAPSEVRRAIAEAEEQLADLKL